MKRDREGRCFPLPHRIVAEHIRPRCASHWQSDDLRQWYSACMAAAPPASRNLDFRPLELNTTQKAKELP